MTEPSTEIVPFGKYKGQPVQNLIADHDYRNWLLSQPWFRERWSNVYQVVINYGAEPQDSPEHNEMQVSFLNDERCLALARLLRPELFDTSNTDYISTIHDTDINYAVRFKAHLDVRHEPAKVQNRSFEYGGWDVIFRVIPVTIKIKAASLPDCECSCDHRGHAERRSKSGTGDYYPSSYDQINSHCAENCPWGNSGAVRFLLRDSSNWQYAEDQMFYLELKPDLGDDFPNVLRQIKNYHRARDIRRCVIVRRDQFERVTWNQVVEVFRSSGITLVHESDIGDYMTVPEYLPNTLEPIDKGAKYPSPVSPEDNDDWGDDDWDDDW